MPRAAGVGARGGSRGSGSGGGCLLDASSKQLPCSTMHTCRRLCCCCCCFGAACRPPGRGFAMAAAAALLPPRRCPSGCGPGCALSGCAEIKGRAGAVAEARRAPDSQGGGAVGSASARKLRTAVCVCFRMREARIEIELHRRSSGTHSAPAPESEGTAPTRHPIRRSKRSRADRGRAAAQQQDSRSSTSGAPGCQPLPSPP